MYGSLRSFVVCFLPFKLGDPACTDLSEGGLDPLGHLLGVRMFCKREGGSRQYVLHYLRCLLPNFGTRVQRKLHDRHEGLSEALSFQVRAIKCV